jgi:4-hydroxy-tetrahydrodipicolinate synthase
MMTAMVTPFDAAGGIDFDGVATLVDHLIATGSTSLLVCGTTGESPTLTHDEKIALLKAVVAQAAGRVPVLMGSGGNCTRSSIELTQEVSALGIDGIMLVCPYYNKPTQEGLFQHFAATARATGLPVMIYNIEARTARNIAPETVARLAREVPNIVAVKEASGSIGQFAAVALAAPEGFTLYSGNDSDTPAILACGGVGVVSVASHVAGRPTRAMIEAFLGGDFERGRRLYLALMPLVAALFPPTSVSPAPVKAALELIGRPVGGLRLPLVPADDAVRADLAAALARLENL